jgi:hypothetical protein
VWRSGDVEWLAIDWPGLGADVTLTRGHQGEPAPILRATITADRWRPHWIAYRGALARVARHRYVAFAGPDADVSRSAHLGLRAACAHLYALMADIGRSDLGTTPTIVLRSPTLVDLPLSRLVAAARPDLLDARALPWDLDPRYPLARAPALAAEAPRWCLPRAEAMTILMPNALDIGRLYAGSPSTIAGDDELSSRNAALMARWTYDLERGLCAARAAGARVVRPATVTDVVQSLEGDHGDCVQLIAHLDEEDRLHCDDGLLAIERLLALVRDRVAGGWRSPLRSIDLLVCGSHARLAGVLYEAGVEYVSSYRDEIHVGVLARWVRALHEQRVYDGRTPFAHGLLAIMERRAATSLAPEDLP